MNAKVTCLMIAGFLVVVPPSRLLAQSDSASLFKSKCALCHAEDGSGNSPSGKALKAKDLRSPEVQTKSDSEMSEVISGGRNKMPSFSQKLTPDQIQHLVAYIRRLAKK